MKPVFATLRPLLVGASLVVAGCGGGGGETAGSASAAPDAAVSPSSVTGTDPLYADQWHLKNTGQVGGTRGEDANLEPAWASCHGGDRCRGEGMTIAIVDDGLEIGHADLAANVWAGMSYNYVTGSTDPTGGDHGTSVAGVAAARDDNAAGGRGAAPRAKLVGYNLLESYTSSNEADALTRNAPDIHVSNNSWGPPDGRGTLDAPPATWRSAIDTGLSSGRGGLGTIYLWAAGNGAPRDNANYDGYTNRRGVTAVCAVGDDGVKASYSEPGANLWVCAPSRGRADHGITTTDRSGAAGYVSGDYVSDFSGTSSAAPLVAGVVSLMLQANPQLGWRDVQLILAQTARRNDPGHSDWTRNGAGSWVNHAYGFGVVDAAAATARAETWTALSRQQSHTQSSGSLSLAVPDANANGIAQSLLVNGSGVSSIEFIEITITVDHPYSGDLEILLTSPAGTVSRLAEAHGCANGSCTQYSGWIFGSARHLGEAADGTWTLTVKDLLPADTGTLTSWSMTFYGH